MAAPSNPRSCLMIPPPLNSQQIKHIQQIVGSFLYYSRATDPTISHALSELATQQSRATENTLQRCNHFLDYMATHPNARISYHTSDMILNVHSGASYLSSPPLQPKPNFGALFLNAKEAKIMRLSLHELGHPQPPTPIHCDNSMAIGIVNNTVKRQKSRSMEMRYFWLLENHINKMFDFQYHPGLENLADYPSKAHPGGHHLTLRPLYVHMPTSPRFLSRAAKPSVRQGCADKVGHTRICKYPLPTLARLWRHVTRPISFTLVVDDFGVKYVGREHAEHLIHVLQENYTMSIDWDGGLYCGIQLNWDYDLRTLDILMSRCIDKVLQRFQHSVPSSPQNGPYKPYPKKYGAAAQDPIPTDASAPLDSNGQKRIQQIVGALLYYARAVDNTILLSLSAIASEQAHPTQLTQKRCQQLLDYCASHLDAVVCFKASDMVLNIHSDASYPSESNARSQIAGHFFLGSVPIDKTPIELNGAIYVFCGILKFVVASAAEAELGPSFSTAKKEKFYASYSRNSGIINHQHLRIVTMRPPRVSPITPSRNNGRAPWKCDSSGSQTRSTDAISKFAGKNPTYRIRPSPT
eukprot:CCRYP_018106-RA/>CCRYP_018106-RA protein AED:0.35 eAED:0.38 QI:0/0/0/1/0/0/3/0/579